MVSQAKRQHSPLNLCGPCASQPECAAPAKSCCAVLLWRPPPGWHPYTPWRSGCLGVHHVHPTSKKILAFFGRNMCFSFATTRFFWRTSAVWVLRFQFDPFWWIFTSKPISYLMEPNQEKKEIQNEKGDFGWPKSMSWLSPWPMSTQRPTRPLCSLPGRPRYDEGTTFELPILVVDHLQSTPWRHGLVEGPGFFWAATKGISSDHASNHRESHD